MTMLVTITNDGPKPHQLEVQVLQTDTSEYFHIECDSIILEMGESITKTVWPGHYIKCTEVNHNLKTKREFYQELMPDREDPQD